MTIKKPSTELLRRYITSQNEDYWAYKKIGALTIAIDVLGSDNSILIASVRWSNSNESQKEKFPNTIDGFCAACEWLDQKRIEYAEQLL